MEIHESAENYLERILMITEQKGEVRSIDIANELGFSKPSVSVAMKKLRENGYIEVDDSGYIRLTASGSDIAQRTYSKHKLLSAVLTAIGVDEETAVEEACRIEHDISDGTYRKIAEFYRKMKTVDKAPVR